MDGRVAARQAPRRSPSRRSNRSSDRRRAAGAGSRVGRGGAGAEGSGARLDGGFSPTRALGERRRRVGGSAATGGSATAGGRVGRRGRRRPARRRRRGRRAGAGPRPRPDRWRAPAATSVRASSARPRSRRDPRQPDDGDRVARVGLGDLREQPLGVVELAAGRAPPRPRAAARSSVVRQHRLGEQQQRRPVVEVRIGDDPLEQLVEDAPEPRARGQPSSAIRSSPRTASRERSSTTDAASSASTRARSSSSAVGVGRHAAADVVRLAQARTGRRSRRSPTRWMNRRTPASPHSGS